MDDTEKSNLSSRLPFFCRKILILEILKKKEKYKYARSIKQRLRKQDPLGMDEDLHVNSVFISNSLVEITPPTLFGTSQLDDYSEIFRM